MSVNSARKRALAAARDHEAKYHWIAATRLYKKVLNAIAQEEVLRKAEVQEKIGYCFGRAAFQAPTKREFKRRTQRAAGAYVRAAAILDSAQTTETDAAARAYSYHCKATVAFLNSWLAATASEKRDRLDEGIQLERQAMRLYREAADQTSMAESCNSLMRLLANRLDITWGAESREKIIDEALECGETAKRILLRSEATQTLIQTYIYAGFFYRHGAFARGLKPHQREERRAKALDYPKTAIELSETLSDTCFLGLATLSLANAHVDILASTGQQEVAHFQKALECGTLTRDHLLIADALYGLEFSQHWRVVVQENPERARDEYRVLCEYGEEAVRHYAVIGHDSGVAMSYFMMLNSVEELSGMETNLPQKLQLIDKSVKAGYTGLKHARRSDAVGTVSLMNSALGTVLVNRARIEQDTDKKRPLLRKALKHIAASINMQKSATAVATLEPVEGNLGIAHWYLALGQIELANIENTAATKIGILKNATKNMQIASENWRIWIESPWTRTEKPHRSWEGMVQMKKGRTLNELHVLTRDDAFLTDSIEAFRHSVKANTEADLPSRVAEAYWQIAKNHHQLGQHPEAAINFDAAANAYSQAAEKMPQLRDFYLNYATYMHSWSDIQNAMHHHERQEYSAAERFYAKAATFYKASKPWGYLAPNYQAWAKLEHGEHLSRQDQTDDAVRAFQEAAALFRQAKTSLGARAEKLDSVEEQHMVEHLQMASDVRYEYCRGRVLLEEAKTLDRRGANAASASRYGAAAERFQRIVDAAEQESDRRELEPIVYLCRAWQMMARAEAEADPDLYLKAAELFDDAKQHSMNERAKILALGHSRFSEALEAGTRFEDTRDEQQYVAATQHLESAANHYRKAGFTIAAEYALATQRLLDAYIYMDLAKKELDPDRRARYYMMAEKVLQSSVESYLNAKHPAKSKQIQQLLQRVRAERELAISLSEVLHTPTFTATTESFATPAATQEQAVGLERFEHANLQVSVRPHPQRLQMGEKLDVGLQMVNVGNEVVQLAKVEDLLSTDFELVNPPDAYRVDDLSLDLKGKRLEPFQTELVDLVVRALDEGTLELKPRIIYADKTGRRMTANPEPVAIEVSPLVQPGRVSTGSRLIDNLLFGGLPRISAIILTSPSCDERELILTRFLDAGASEGGATFYVTPKALNRDTITKRSEANFYFFICNPHARTTLPNVFTLKGVENLTDLNIALNMALRRLGAPLPSDAPRRACLGLISDVLLQHHAVQTRRWLNALLPELKSHGFTTLAVMDPGMHPPAEVRAILDLFDGEISIYERRSASGSETFLKINKLVNHTYLDSERPVDKKKLRT